VKKNIVIATIVTFCFIGIISTFLITTTQSQTKVVQKADEDLPTSITLGVKTEKQKKHSKLYEEQALLLQPSLINKEDVTIYVTVFPGPILTEDNLKNKYDILQKVSCKTDVIVRGKIKDKGSQLTENQSFVFTDYDIEIEDVIKNSSPMDLVKTKGLTLTAKGGSIKLDNRVFKVIVERSVPLRVGKDYIFFLKYLPDSQSFSLTTEQSMFEVTSNAQNVIVEKKVDKNVSEDLEPFLNLLPQATLNGCLK
jgi:hypothetical protein